MGKGTIISGGTAGLYQLQVNFYRDQYTTLIAALTQKETDVQAELAAETDEDKINALKITLLSVQKRKEYLENNFPSDETISAWCADYTENLTGSVGTIEVPGERGTVQIYPGQDGEATYNQTRDGQLVPTLTQTPEQAFYNIAMMPGWQKWKPTFRYATIDSISGDTADITLEATTSSEQSLNINQQTSFSNVTIEYMTCDGSAFSVGDSVLVKFENQSISSPKIVGFKDNPQPCSGLMFCGSLSGWCFIWDMGSNAYCTSVTDNSSTPVTSWPVAASTISTWLAGYSQYEGSQPFTYDDISGVGNTVSYENTSSNLGDPVRCIIYDIDGTASREVTYPGENGSVTLDQTVSMDWTKTLTANTYPDASYPYVTSDSWKSVFTTITSYPFYPYDSNICKRVYSNTNVSATRGRRVSVTITQDSESTKIHPNDVNNVDCELLGDDSSARTDTDNSYEYDYTFYSPFSDGGTDTFTLEQSQVQHYDYTTDWVLTSDVYSKEEFYSEAFELIGNVGNESAPFLAFLYYNRFISKNTSDSGPTTYPTQLETWKGYYTSTTGDPDDLNPFEASYNADFSTALAGLGTPTASTKILFLTN